VAGDSLFIGWPPQDFAAITRAATVLSGGPGNGLFVVAGVMLTLVTPALRAGFLLWTWAMWGAGVAVTIFSLGGIPAGTALATAVLFTLFCPWVIALAWQLG